jgi:glutamine cyclotransferase
MLKNKSMKNIILVLIANLITVSTFAQTYSNPESVDYDTASGRYFIANINSGRIQVREPNGTLSSLTTNAISPAPYGIEFAAGKLYACCGTTVKVFNPATGAQIISIPVSGASFLNGITHDNNENVYVTDFSAKKIYKIDQSNTVTTIVANTTNTPNGIMFDPENNRLIYVCWGNSARIKAVSLADFTQTILLTSALSNIDGIARDNQGNYYVSNWGANSIVKYSNTFTSPQTVVTGLTSPADIFYNLLTDTLAIPNSTNTGSVTFWGNPQITTAINTSKEKETLVFPNPSNSILYLKSLGEEIVAVELFDLTGKLVFSEQHSSFEKLDLSSINSGTYILNAMHKNGSVSKHRIQKN